MSEIPYGNWMRTGSDGFVLLDPMSGTDFDPNRPSDFLLKRGDFADMAQHMSLLHDNTELDIFYSNGDTRVEDLGPNFEAIDGGQYDAIGHAVAGVFQSDTRERSLLPQNVTPAAELIALKSLEAGEGFSAGLRVDAYNQPVTDVERTIDAMYKTANDMDPEIAAHWAVQASAEANEEWYIALGTGVLMSEIGSRIYQKRCRNLGKVALILPYQKAGVGLKFRELGMGNIEENDLIPGSFDNDREAIKMYEIKRTGRIDRSLTDEAD